MPSPVCAARQCLAGEAASALDEAVAVARRRAHAQTTSLHVVSGLLSLPSSSSSLLRDALSRARSSAYSPRLQLKALELCFSVALDRLPSSSAASSPADPPVSNSLMAAIKRSQANQRRNPETFHLYHHQLQQQQQQQSSSFAGVKVDLQQLVLSILDDPVVSRVFCEAGFRSCDIKFAILRPPPILRFPRATRCPPLFLCNFSGGDDFDVAGNRRFGFPFSPGQLLSSDGADENCRRIGEVLARKRGRNPLLVGAGASDAAQDFVSTVARQNWAVLPPETCGVKLVSIEKEVSDFLSGGGDPLLLDSRFGELGRLVEENQSGPGLIVKFGDLKVFVDMGGGEEVGDEAGANHLVSELTRLVSVHRERLWLMGSAASYEIYTKFLAQFPSVVKDWDLQLLPITTLRPGSGGLSPRPNSLMESFVPFGGFFPMAYDATSPLGRPYLSAFRCQQCNEKYEQEVSVVLKECSVSVPDQHQTNLPPWLLKTELVTMNNKFESTKTKDDGAILLNSKIADLQRKWNDVCQRNHRGSQMLGTDNIEAEAFHNAVDLRHVADEVRNENEACKITDAASVQSERAIDFPTTVGLQETSSLNQCMPMPVVSEPKSVNLLSKLQGGLSKSELVLVDGHLSQSGASLMLDLHGGHPSSSSVPSVTTDLMLGTVHAHLPKGERPTIQSHIERLNTSSGCFPSKIVEANNSVSVAPRSSFCLSYSDSPVLDTHLHVKTPSASNITTGGVSVDRCCRNSSNLSGQIDPSNFKALYRCLMEKVGRQEEAICAITETVVRFKTGNERLRGASLKGDIWFTFLGHDKFGKRRIAAALAELIFGSRENLICVDLSLQGGSSNRICDRQEINGSDMNIRGKMVVDHVADEIRKNPCSVIFLENVDKSDFLVQNSLSQAKKTGKFSDSHGREVSINNAIIITTARSVKGKTDAMTKEDVNFSEERILAAECHEMKMLVEPVSNARCLGQNINVMVTARKEQSNKQHGAVFVSKRKLNSANNIKEQCESSETPKRAHKTPNTFLDLNLPVEEMVTADTYSSGEDSNCSSGLSENSEAWLEDFLDSMDDVVFCRPFDFDALANRILKEVTDPFQNTFGSDCLMEIDQKVMEQILAATWLLEDMEALNRWLLKVLHWSFVEARKRYYLSTQTVIRLVTCEDAVMEEQAPGILLPSRIHLN